MVTKNVRDALQASAEKLRVKLQKGYPLSKDNKVVAELKDGRLPAELKTWAFGLFESNMKEMYEASEDGYDAAEKKDEMIDHHEARFLVVRTGNGPIGFTSFRFDTEETAGDKKAEVVYCYEVQVEESERGKGAGKLLMEMLGHIGKDWEMAKIFSTQMSTETPVATPPPVADTTSTPPPSSSPAPAGKPKAKGRRHKTIKRRGAKVEEDEGEEEESGKATASAEPTTDSESDFSESDDSDDDDDDEGDAEAEDGKEAQQTSGEELKDGAASGVDEEGNKGGSSSSTTTAAAPALASGPLAQAAQPSWSDSPASGEQGAGDLPTLDFAALSPDALANASTPASTSPKPSAPASKAGKAGPAEGVSKRAAAIAKREAKSAALKEQDPVAWEAREKERKERELEKKKLKKEKRKEKELEKRLEKKEAAAAAAPASEAPATTTTKPEGPKKATRPPVPSRPSRTAIELGLAKPSPDSPEPSTSTSQPSSARATPSAPRNNVPPTGPRQGPPRQRFNGPFGGPPPDFQKAREDYQAKLADPAYVPKVGKFWSHDDRLAAPEVRVLHPYWRGRGRGGEYRGAYRGRGGFGGRGAYAGGWGNGVGREAVNGDEEKEAGEKESEKGESGEATNEVKETKKAGKAVQTEDPEDADDDEDDGWGRGEAKRKPRPSTSAHPSFPAWNHDGFEEMKDEAPRPRRGGGALRGRGRGAITGPPGSINPAYAHLPFHPLHRFPPAPAPPPEDSTTSRPIAGESTLFENSAADESATTTNVVRLPGGVQPPADIAKATEDLSLESDEPRGVVINLGPRSSQPVTVFPKSAQEIQEEKNREASRSILYAADPSRVPVSEEPVPSPYQAPLPPPGGYMHQLPPHLQQAPPLQQPQFIPPRHGSPATFYPHYYSPDSFPNMPTPGATPPPLFSQGATGFFAPPRQSKVEIKAPGTSQSPLNSKGPQGEPYSPAHRSSPSIPYTSANAPSFQPADSPVSVHDEMGNPTSPQQRAAYAYAAYPPNDGFGPVYYGQQPPMYAYPGQQYAQQDPAVLSMQQGMAPQYYAPQQGRAPMAFYGNGAAAAYPSWMPPPAPAGY
ncbi:acyl-CoA N-acyltransferase [Pseudohyphozyma bogoriensis]|nr:acyl-CoA N-acyltransferase [Pseudohyphozyma bogoriensis]